jgi:glycyl-tRNA synthetase alpha chain
MHINLFDIFEAEAIKLINKKLILPAYDFCLKCSHEFNILDARGALSTNERTAYITKVRIISKKCASAYLKMLESKDSPLSGENQPL